MQLEIFDNLIEKSNKLLDALNIDRKPKDVYFGHEIHKIGNLYLLSCISSVNDFLFNILDKRGNIPDGYSSCWRVWTLISKELNIKHTDMVNYKVEYVGRGLNGKNNGYSIQQRTKRIHAP